MDNTVYFVMFYCCYGNINLPTVFNFQAFFAYYKSSVDTDSFSGKFVFIYVT